MYALFLFNEPSAPMPLSATSQSHFSLSAVRLNILNLQQTPHYSVVCQNHLTAQDLNQDIDRSYPFVPDNNHNPPPNPPMERVGLKPHPLWKFEFSCVFLKHPPLRIAEKELHFICATLQIFQHVQRLQKWQPTQEPN